MERVAMYLRKSRADLEAEKKGEGETLTKHRKALFKFAQQQNLNVIEVYSEVKSGEKLIHRPEMQRLMDDVENGKFDAVLVMDIDRLGRGNMQEQGYILNTFRASETKIVTPTKTYDLMDESDELMTEIQTLFARQELKIITRRMQRGRVQSVEAGNYIGTRPPYGYEIVKEGKSRWLVPHPEQSKVVTMIFEWYTDDTSKIGTAKISNRLNEMGLKTYTGISWAPSSVLTIIKNEVYIGRMQWKKKKYDTTAEGRTTIARPKEDIIDAKGKHEPLVNEEMFAKAQEILKGKYHVPYQLVNGISNPLAGLIRCAKCGYAMTLRPYSRQESHLKCPQKECDCRSSKFEFVENAVVSALKDWLKSYKLEIGKNKPSNRSERNAELKQMAVNSFAKEREDLELQKGRLHDFLERGIYSEDVYLERSQGLAIRMDETNKSLERAEQELTEELNRETKQNNIIPLITNVIKLYERSTDQGKKNTLLKSILEKIEYKKESHQRNDEFEIELFPKV